MHGLYHFPADLEQIISAHAREDGGQHSSRAIAEAITRLSDLFNGKIAWDSRYHRDPVLRRAYLEYFLPVNLPKIHVPLAAWMALRPDRWAGRTLRCLDLGSGPGTALLGLADFVRELPADLRPRSLDLVATDLSPENLRDAATLLDRFAGIDPRIPPLNFRGLRLDLVDDRSGLFPLAKANGKFDLVLAANVVCELLRGSADGMGRAEKLFRTATAEVLEPHGAIILLEPGLRETCRDLHRLRDRLVAPAQDHAPPSLHVHAPCLHEQPCPALSSERDWCYNDMAWEPPPRVSDLDRRTGLRKGSLKFSYLLLSPDPPHAPDHQSWRVVSDVLDLKGERRLYLCADGRWIVFAQLKRERGPHDEVFRSLRRGDLIEIERLESRGAVFRLAPGAAIRRQAPEPG